jgi:hypothetical protein
MRRTTIFLDERLLRRAKDVARREGKSFAQVVREAVAGYVAGYVAGASRAGADTVPSIAGRFASGYADTAERADELLWREPHD